MKKLAWLLAPIALGFFGWLFVDAHASPQGLVHLIQLTGEPRTSSQPVPVLFTGDVMLDRGIALHAAVYGKDSLVEGVRGLLLSADIVVINLEGTITQNASVSIANHADLRFTFDPSFARWLKGIGVTAASLSNNHSDDFGPDGYASTKAYLDAADILHFGAPDNARDLSTSVEAVGQRLCLVGYEGFINTDPGAVAEEIVRLRPGCEFIAATMHAGTEYAPGFTALQQAAARAFIDAGADVVIGTHPHVVEPLELYRGKPIFYSLGNFLFDQDFSQATEHGLVVKALISATSTTYILVPTTLLGGEAGIARGAEASTTLEALITPELPPEIARQLRNGGSFTVVR